MWLPFFCVCICILYTKIKEKIDDRMRKVIFESCGKQEDKKYATKQERKFYLFRDDVFYHGALDEYLQCYSSYGCTEFWYYLCSICISSCMVVPMVIIMSMYGALEGCVKSGNWSLLFIIWLTNIPKNFIMALPFQLLIAGPLVRKVFRSLFPVGKVLA